MENNISKTIFPLILLIIIGTLMVHSSLLALRKQQETMLAYQKVLAQQKAEKDAEDKIYLLGKFDQSTRPDFAQVPAEYNVGGYTMYLRKETLEAFENMAESASKDNIELNIASATRNFDYQKDLWNKKWESLTLVDGKNLFKSIPDGEGRFDKILEYSAVPGMSRHHWGTDIDINDANPQYFETEKGENVYNWLTKNASEYGFCQPYTAKGTDRPEGYNEEKWHWSYLPLARAFTQEYKNLITPADISGFDGDEYVAKKDLMNYVLSINPECL